MAVDFYDVEAMIRDARSSISGEIARAVEEAVTRLREEIGAERVDRQDAIEGLQRVIDSRTGHLA